MKEFNTSLLREKFILHEQGVSLNAAGRPFMALSNRMVAELKDEQGKLVETFVVRAQNMHSCVRMAAEIVDFFKQKGPLLSQNEVFDWEREIWSKVVNNYERIFNAQLWGAIYNKGKVVFKSGNVYPLLDVIEKCDVDNIGEYEDSISIAEHAFKQTGKVVKIEYDGNVALVVDIESEQCRCSIILRRADKTTTFSYAATKKNKDSIDFFRCMAFAANFLEGVQLAFMIGINEGKMRLGLISSDSYEGNKTQKYIDRIATIGAGIIGFESMFTVKYRPEKPDFRQIINEAELLAQKILLPP